jgi:hypothetical protein
MSHRFSRRQWLKGMAGFSGAALAARTGLWSSTAAAQAAPSEKAALLIVFLQGGYNAVFCSADSFAGAGTFGVTGSNQKALGNGLVVDGPTLGTLPQFALDHMATVGVRHGLTSHEAAQEADFSDGRGHYAIQLAAVMGGDAAIKCVQVGSRNVPGPKPIEAGVSMQTITDMRTTIEALGGSTDGSTPKREIAEKAIDASRFMSAQTLVTSPAQTKVLGEGYNAAIETLRQPVKPFDFAELATAYGLSATATAVNSFRAQIAAAELMITAGANVVVAMDGGWDTHGDRDGASVRNMMNTRILPPLKTFIDRMVAAQDRNVVVAIMGDFARSLPGSDHAAALSVTVIGKYVRPGTTGRMNANVQLPAGTPSVPGLWAYLAKVLRVDQQPFGTNPHTGLVVT